MPLDRPDPFPLAVMSEPFWMARVLADAIPKLLVDSELTTLPSITISFVLYIALDTALAVIF